MTLTKESRRKCQGIYIYIREAGWSCLSFMWFHRKKEPYLPDGRNAETFAPHRSCCTGTCLDSRRKPGNSPPVGPANWSGCPLCSSSSPGTEECNRMPVYPRTWFGYDECIRRKVIQRSFYPPLSLKPRLLCTIFLVQDYFHIIRSHANKIKRVIHLIIRDRPIAKRFQEEQSSSL